MIVQFIRPAPYDYILEGHSLYESYDRVSRNLLTPKINTVDFGKNTYNKYPIVVSSPLKRATATADALSKRYTVMSELREIEYSMKQLMSAEEFESLGKNATNLARQRFFEALYADDLTETLQDVQIRVKRVIEMLKDLNKDTLAVSHGFFMKYLEIALLDNRAVEDINILKQHYSGNHIAYGFLQGFTINLTNEGRV